MNIYANMTQNPNPLGNPFILAAWLILPVKISNLNLKNPLRLAYAY